MTAESERAALLLRRIDELAAISETDDGLLTRTFGSPAMRLANLLVGGWLDRAGLRASTDGIGNLRAIPPRDGRPLLLLGSHLDTVREAGRFDGPLGVLVALDCAEQAAAGRYGTLPFRLGVVGFSDEEGVRFGSSYLGSDMLAGHRFTPERLRLTDANGLMLAEVLRDAFGTADLRRFDLERIDPVAEGGLLGYVEVHIEQGPVLEAQNLPVGIVSAIAGQSRFTFRFEGKAGHAGTTPMPLRHDALAGAARFVTAVETIARHHSGLVATVGQLDVRPGAGNVIPGSVTGSLDVRSPDNAERRLCSERLHENAFTIAAERGLTLGWQLVQEHAATPLDAGLRARLAAAIAAAGFPVHELPSGAGHDAVALAPVMPAVMLFVRCRDGLSHHPLESVAPEDVAAALKVMDNFLGLLAQSPLATPDVSQA